MKVTVESRLGALEKEVRIFSNQEKIDFVYNLNWEKIPPGSLRFGDIVLNPNNFDLDSLELLTHNGGYELESYKIGTSSINHGQSWSTLVSAQQCLGITEGFLIVGDKKKQIRISTNPMIAKVPGLVTFEKFRDNYLFRVQFSARELDDTSQALAINLPASGRMFQISVEAGDRLNG